MFDFIADAIDVTGYGPTVREIAEGVGLSSTGSVVYILNQLERQGRIRRSLDRRAIITLVEQED